MNARADSDDSRPWTVARLLEPWTVRDSATLAEICNLSSNAPRFWFDPGGAANPMNPPGAASMLKLARHRGLTAAEFGQLMEDWIILRDRRPRGFNGRRRLTENRLYTIVPR